jgi:hypothetical protein
VQGAAEQLLYGLAMWGMGQSGPPSGNDLLMAAGISCFTGGKGSGDLPPLRVKWAKQFVHGEDFEAEFATPLGDVSLLAETEITGTKLHLKDVAIYPSNAGSLNVGVRDVIRVRDVLANLARRQGFTELRITGTRYSGANPMKDVDITINLTGGAP